MAVSRIKALSHNDTKDRKVATDFLNSMGWYNIIEGGEYDLDLQVPEFKRGADVEQISYGMNRFKSYNHFRIPYRKQKYWSGLSFFINKKNKKQINPYQNWYVDYIQFLDLGLTEFLWYDWKLIKEYHKNTIFDINLPQSEWGNDIERTFITIPYQIGLERIKHYKLIDGNWNLVK